MRTAALALLALLCCALPACKPTDPKKPETWLARLDDPDPKLRAQAVQELRKLHAKQAAPQIAALLRDPMVREDAAVALGDLGGPEQVQPLLDAIDSTVGAGSDAATRQANRTNAKIADSLGDLGDVKAGPALLRLARSRDDLVRLQAVQALGKVKYPEAVAELSHIVDEEASPPLLIKKSIVALGDIASPAGIPALQHALVLERQGVSFLSEASYALLQIGAPAVKPMLEIAQDQDASYLAWAKENNRAPAGTYSKAALVLGDLGDPRAIPVLLAKLKYQDPDPIPSTARLLTNVVRQFAADALGRLRVKEAAGPIAALVTTASPQDEDLATFTSHALVWIGERAQAKELLRRAQSGAIRPRLVVARSAALLGDPALRKDLAALAAKERRGGNCAQAAGELLGAPADDKGACEAVGDAFAALEAPLVAADDCKADTACWAGKVKDSSALVRARAAVELGHAGDAAQASALLALAADGDPLVRLCAIRALEWLAQVPGARDTLKAAAPKLRAQWQAEQGRMQFVKVNEELRRLGLRLARL